jgi:hypothetical protein
MKDLGEVNGWRETPLEVKDCTHLKEVKVVGRSYTEYICRVCGYRYRADSGD